jgi:hypothetical protein
MSKGVIILLVILAVLVLAIGGCIALLAFAGNEVVNELEDSFGVADEDHYDITLEECSADELGDAMANGTITNTSGDQRAFAVEVRFTDAEGTLITEDTTYTDDLDPDQTGQWEVVTFEDAPSGIECEIGEVSNWGLEGD